MFQHLREWRNEARAKKGEQRQEVAGAACFVWLLAWVLALWDPTHPQLVLVLDATTVAARLVVLSLSVVAWHIQRAGVKGAHKPHWLRFLELVHSAVPPQWQVLVMADRGLSARWLYQPIVQYGWHPFLCINLGCKARPQAAKRGSPFEPLTRLVPRKGTQWSGGVLLFKQRSTPVLYLIGTLGRRIPRSVGHPDRPAGRADRSLLVWVALLD